MNNDDHVNDNDEIDNYTSKTRADFVVARAKIRQWKKNEVILSIYFQTIAKDPICSPFIYSWNCVENFSRMIQPKNDKNSLES